MFHDGDREVALPLARRRVEWIITRSIVEHGTPRFVFVGKEALRAAPQIYRRMGFCAAEDLVLCLPHTSGVNSWYNSDENTQLAARALQGHLAGAPSHRAQQGPQPPGATPTPRYPSEAYGRALQRLVAALPKARLPLVPARRLEEVLWMLDTWHSETGAQSAPDEILRHWVPRTLAAQEGLRVVPILIEKLDARPSLWEILLLYRVTGVDPVRPEHMGAAGKMAQDWIRWYAATLRD